MKFVMTQAVCPQGLAMLENIAEVYVANDRDPNNYLDRMQDADAIIVRIARMDGNAIRNSPKLRVIGRTGVGCDTVDVREASSRGIPVVITPGANNHSVAEHTVAMMFALSKNLVEGHIESLKGNYEIRAKGAAFELAGKTALFIGLGAIGKDAALICRAIGMRVAAYDPFLSRENVESLGFDYCPDYRKMLAHCDFLSLHVPLTGETRGMIGAGELAAMKKTAMLVNCARGGIADEAALAAALNSGTIAGAGIDAFEEDPPSLDNALLNAKNVIVSPHSAAQTREAVINMATMCVSGCLAVLRGERWPHVADKRVYEHELWQKA